ncbi:MAG TPA: M13 family metallopeptidase [Pyrinomonadaceae bacterium]|jgi:endothelin-converting enzyme/putative endopeptidase|nr:M13 family metallopeptidase [Pyrinomonadaceae bacterium]
MRIFRTSVVFLLLVSCTFGQSLKGVAVGDMDSGALACDDFYSYANGKWRQDNPIPASMVRWSRRWQAGEMAKDKVRLILEDVVRSSEKSAPARGTVDQIVGDFYQTCADEALADKNGLTPIKQLLTKIDNAKTKADIQALIAELALNGISAPFGFHSSPDLHAPENVIASINAAGLGLPDRDYYWKTEPRFVEAREKYVAHIKKMLELADPSKGAGDISTAIYDFESQLALASLDNVALRDPAATDHKMKFAELQKLTPNFDWAAFYKRVGVKPADLNVSEPEFMKGFNKLLNGREVWDWQQYLKWLVINTASNDLSKPFVDTNFAFYNQYLSGATQMKPRATRCAQEADGLMGEAVGKKYVEKYFPPEAKARMTSLVQNLIAAMKEIIEGLDWMSPETKKRALEKLTTLKPKIGYPDKWKNYSALRIGRDSHIGNVGAAIRFLTAEDLARIGKPVDRERWEMTPATSDAQYNPLLNDITFPAGILQPPAFSLDVSDPVNYGAIGVVIGHEISHGYDDQGAQFDATGHLNNWWTKEDYAKFQARTECVSKQFEGYFIEPGIHHNGKLVLGESIADLAGARIAYKALEISRRGKGPLPTIDGFTPEQQFFIAWGQFRGDATRPETMRQMIQGDPHPVAKWRVIGPLSNLLDFQKTFGCSATAPMVRPAADRCEVW